MRSGKRALIAAPRGATHVDLTGKTVIPAMINVHVHIGYEGYTSWGAENYTPQNVLDHLQREAFYGIGATQTVGSSPTDASIEFQQDQLAGKFPPASRFFFMPGMAPPNGGPDATLMKGTKALHAVYEVSTGDEARAAVQSMAKKNLKNVKIWVDDRRGTYPKMTPEVYNAVIDEAHKHGMLVHAHALTLADQKAVVRAGVDVLVHIITEPVDDEFLALLREKKPYWTPVMGLGDRSEVCDNDPFVDQVLPDAAIASIRKSSCGPLSPNAEEREKTLAANFPKMIASGVRIVLGTDAGIINRYSFGWADHHELARYVQFGLTPSQAIVCATKAPAELIGIKGYGDAGRTARAPISSCSMEIRSRTFATCGRSPRCTCVEASLIDRPCSRSLNTRINPVHIHRVSVVRSAAPGPNSGAAKHPESSPLLPRAGPNPSAGVPALQETGNNPAAFDHSREARLPPAPPPLPELWR